MPVFQFEPSPSPTTDDARKALLVDPGFGRVFTDHMATAVWTAADGWHDFKIRARRPFQIDPAAAVLHYAQEIFEGLKAYRASDDSLLLFRPEQNARRFNMSANRLAMPAMPEEMFIDAIEQLVRADAAWVPDDEGSLYLRPFMFASEAFLGVRPSDEYIFCVIASPAGQYFKGGKQAVSLWVSDELNRAGPGGTGAAKCGGNYAASLVAQAVAYQHECDQVVYLDAVEHRWVDELGGMNVFFVFDDGSVITPPLGGTILPGITRASIIDLLKRKGVDISERPYAIDDWRHDAKSGRLWEAFACGTAAVVTPIGRVKRGTDSWIIGDGMGGPVTANIKAQLAEIQRGQRTGPDGWVRRVEVPASIDA